MFTPTKTSVFLEFMQQYKKWEGCPAYSFEADARDLLPSVIRANYRQGEQCCLCKEKEKKYRSWSAMSCQLHGRGQWNQLLAVSCVIHHTPAQAWWPFDIIRKKGNLGVSFRSWDYITASQMILKTLLLATGTWIFVLPGKINIYFYPGDCRTVLKWVLHNLA